VGRGELFRVSGDLGGENVGRGGGGDEAEEGRGGVEWTRAEFGVGLKTDKVGVV
jgi:hypothetical protein